MLNAEISDIDDRIAGNACTSKYGETYTHDFTNEPTGRYLIISGSEIININRYTSSISQYKMIASGSNPGTVQINGLLLNISYASSEMVSFLALPQR